MSLRRRMLLVATLPLLSGCATLRATLDGWETGADGLTHSQRDLRNALSSGDFQSALEFREGDALLRMLQTGITAYYAGDFMRSAALLDSATLLSEERLTTSVSKGGLSLVTNDLARAYQLRPTERLFVPYYAMLDYCRTARWEDAAVEARRLVSLLARASGDADPSERPLHAAMQYLAGVVLEKAGDRDESRVSFRIAHALVAAYPERPAARGPRDGEVLVVIERGFVAHRASETIFVGAGDDEREHEHDFGGAPRRASDGPGAPVNALHPMAAVALVAPARVPTADSGARSHPVVRERRRRDDADGDVPALSLAFPALRRSPSVGMEPPRVVTDRAGGDTLSFDVQTISSVDDASAVDERRERARIVGRELVRASAQYAVSKALEDRSGETAGRLARVGAAVMARADVRSWHLLPQQLVLVRLHVRSGRQTLRLDTNDAAHGAGLSLGELDVTTGEVTIVPTRVWHEHTVAARPRCPPDAWMCAP